MTLRISQVSTVQSLSVYFYEKSTSVHLDTIVSKRDSTKKICD